MAVKQKSRRRRNKKNSRGTGADSRPSHKTLAAALRESAHNLALIYSTCVTVQHALQAQKAEEDTEIEECLRHHVTASLYRELQDLRELAQALHPAEETP